MQTSPPPEQPPAQPPGSPQTQPPSLPILLFRLIVVQVLIHASMTGMRMAAPLLALRQGHGAIAAGVLVSLFALAPVFLSVPAGRFADRNPLSSRSSTST